MFRRDGTTYTNTAFGTPPSTSAVVLGSIEKLDYSIRRWAISDHPSKTTQPPMRTDARLNEIQRAIGRYLAAEYERAQPMPDRLIALLRQIEQPAAPNTPPTGIGNRAEACALFAYARQDIEQR
jgi:hypothetical protein